MIGISKEDISFLIELQHEMLTQDTVCQASPRFWVVQGTVREYGIENGYCDGEEFLHDTECVAENVKEAIKYLKDEYSEELKERKIAIRKNGDYIEFSVNGGDYIETIYDMEDIAEFLNDNGFSDFRVVNYRNVDKNYENTMFLTNRECKAHIKSNYYHYPKDAHSYAMTAWRAPEVSKLFTILDKINWSKIETLIP